MEYLIEMKWNRGDKEVNLYYIVNKRELKLIDNEICFIRDGRTLRESACDEFSVHDNFNIKIEFNNTDNIFYCTIHANREMIYCYKNMRYMRKNRDMYGCDYFNVIKMGGEKNESRYES